MIVLLNPFFLERMKNYLGTQYDSFYKSYNQPNVRGLNLNKKFQISPPFEQIFDVKIAKIPYIDGGYYLEEDVKMGFHPLHHAGAFYMQDPSAMVPPYCVKIADDSLVLDLCAAPGGKSIELANILTHGTLIANEIDFKRAKVLTSNIERMGLSNVIVTNNNPSDFVADFQEMFDVILVDAPCSGEGMFRKYPDGQDIWSLDEVKKCQERDYEIVDIAYKLLKRDGILIYSTCTFSKEENEDIVKYLKDKYQMSSLAINEVFSPILTEGFIPNTYRFYPHIALGEGQFVAALRKIDGSIRIPKMLKNNLNYQEFSDFQKKYLNEPIQNIIKVKEVIYYTPLMINYRHLNVLSYGVRLGTITKGRLEPFHHFFKGFSSFFKSQLTIDYRDERVLKYLRGEQIEGDCLDGYGVLFINGVPLGGYKAKNGILNNLYPKGLRNF